MQPRRGGGMTKRKDPAGRAIHSFRRRWTLTGSIAYGTQAGGLKVKIASNSLRLRGPYVPRNSPGQNTGVGSLSLLQGIFPIQESNRGLLHCRWILYQMSHQGRGTGMSIKHPSGFWIQGRREFSAGWALPEGVLRGIGGTGRTEPRSSPKLACKPVLWRVSSVYRKEHLFPLILWKATCAASPCQHPNPWGAKDRSWRLFQAPTKVPLSPAAALPAHYREHTDSRHPAVAPRLYVPQRQQLQGSPAPARAPHHTCASRPVAVLLVRQSLHAQMQGVKAGCKPFLTLVLAVDTPGGTPPSLGVCPGDLSHRLPSCLWLMHTHWSPPAEKRCKLQGFGPKTVVLTRGESRFLVLKS